MIFVKMTKGLLTPMDADDIEGYERIKEGTILKCIAKKERSVGYHKRFFKLMRLLYDTFEPKGEGVAVYKGQIVEKNFKQFRKDIIIIAGYREAVFRADGSFVMEAKSISFENMKQEEFQKLYSAVIDVGLKRLPHLYKTAEELDEAVNKLLTFA